MIDCHLKCLAKDCSQEAADFAMELHQLYNERNITNECAAYYDVPRLCSNDTIAVTDEDEDHSITWNLVWMNVVILLLFLVLAVGVWSLRRRSLREISENMRGLSLRKLINQ